MTTTDAKRTKRKSPKTLTKEQNLLLCDELVRIAKETQPTTLRSIYYQVVLSASLPFMTKDEGNSKTNENIIGSRVAELRRSGRIDWDWIKDESRPDYSVRRWDNPADFADSAKYFYGLDYWKDQPIRPVVVIEKAAQLSVFRDHVQSFGVDVQVTKGFNSLSSSKRFADKIQRWNDEGQSACLLVGADFDPSGDEWPTSLFDEIQYHLTDPGMVQMKRLFMTTNDLDDLGPAVALRAPNPKDSRTKNFLERYSFDADEKVCVEMDALNPNEARRRMGQEILNLFDGDLEELREREADDRLKIREALESTLKNI